MHTLTSSVDMVCNILVMTMCITKTITIITYSNDSNDDGLQHIYIRNEGAQENKSNTNCHIYGDELINNTCINDSSGTRVQYMYISDEGSLTKTIIIT